MVGKTGWYNKNKSGRTVKYESHRHALASKGIKTALPKGVKNVSFSGSPTPNFDMVKKNNLVKIPISIKKYFNKKSVSLKDVRDRFNFFGGNRPSIIKDFQEYDALKSFLNRKDVTYSDIYATGRIKNNIDFLLQKNIIHRYFVIRNLDSKNKIDQKLIKEIALRDKNIEIRMRAINKINDINFLKRIASEDMDFFIREIANERIIKLTNNSVEQRIREPNDKK
ncbi:hypothetical protein GQ473_03835 [archaeon]|nr:hypothetical protein [archaeon]